VQFINYKNRPLHIFNLTILLLSPRENLRTMEIISINAGQGNSVKKVTWRVPLATQTPEGQGVNYSTDAESVSLPCIRKSLDQIQEATHCMVALVARVQSPGSPCATRLGRSGTEAGFSDYVGFPYHLSFHQCSTLICHQGLAQ
jgi:hypothetical protein